MSVVRTAVTVELLYYPKTRRYKCKSKLFASEIFLLFFCCAPKGLSFRFADFPQNVKMLGNGINKHSKNLRLPLLNSFRSQEVEIRQVVLWHNIVGATGKTFWGDF